MAMGVKARKKAISNVLTDGYTNAGQEPEPEEDRPDVDLNIGLRLAESFAIPPGHTERLNAKVHAMRLALSRPEKNQQPAQLEVRTDFDDTMTRRQPGTWKALHYGLTEERREASQQERAENIALQEIGALSLDALRQWTQREALRHAEDGTHEEVMIGEAKRIKELRSGTKELFDFCYKRRIPVRIVTAGVTNVIKYVAAREGLKVTNDNIIGNTLHLNEAGHTTHWDEENAVDSFNKGERVEKKFPRQKGHKRCIIVLGDSLHDTMMATNQPGDIVIRVRTGQDGGNSAVYLDESFSEDPEAQRPYFDLVIRNEGLEAVITLLGIITAQLE
jgi:HAD superfamily phosphoserine phosphatase-like hydrolase